MSAISTARALRKAGQAAEAVSVITDAVRRDVLNPEELEIAGRFLRGLADKGAIPAPALSVRVLGQCTTSWLSEVLVAVCAGRGLPTSVSDGGYDQVLPELMSLAPGETQVLVFVPWTGRLLGSADRSPADRLADELGFWRGAWERASALGCKVVQVGYDAAAVGALGNQLSAKQGDLRLIRDLNAALQDALPAGAGFVDLEALAGEVGRRQFYDARRWYWTKQPFSEAGTVELARAIAASLAAVTTGPKKVLVLDADNTLWGGVVGETGPLGIQLGDSPDGEAFRAFQAWCLALSRRGVLLALATKNELDDAKGPFLDNPHMILRLEDFAAIEAHWEPKSTSMTRIAQRLNLGVDSLVFFDDNPAEREQVRQALPEVVVVDVPADPVGYIGAIERGRWFEASGLTAEDAARARQYQVEAARAEHASAFTDVAAWLTSLEMRGELRAIDEADLPRVVQLLGKTNQWNLTTRRHGAAAVSVMVNDPRSVAFTLRLADRFGDHGLVAVLLAAGEGDNLRVDTWLMSCRVISRTAEEFVFRALVTRARALGYRTIVGDYVPTRKNAQVAELYPRLGFRVDGAPPDEPEGRRFVVDLAEVDLPVTHVHASDVDGRA